VQAHEHENVKRNKALISRHGGVGENDKRSDWQFLGPSHIEAFETAFG
jgi:hypothetical protein